MAKKVLTQKPNELPDFPRVISIGFLEGRCNLTCPKCPVFGENRDKENPIKGEMPLEEARKLFDEIKGTHAVVSGQGYTEPFLQKNLWEYLKEMRARDIPVSMNTNGLLMTDEYAQRIIDLKIDCIFVSIDAMTKEALKKVRSTDKLEKITDAVFSLLKARGDTVYTRIGVSFVEEEANKHEKDDFINYWTQYVDAVRVCELWSGSSHQGASTVSVERRPCSMLYDNMLIHHNGDVSICCWDGKGVTKMGNVFKQGIKGVWLGEDFQKARYYHETGQYDKVPYCLPCTDWLRNEFIEEETVADVLIRRTPLLTYYNRIDKLQTWKNRHVPIN